MAEHREDSGRAMTMFCMPLTLIMRQVRARVATRLQVSSAA